MFGFLNNNGNTQNIQISFFSINNCYDTISNKKKLCLFSRLVNNIKEGSVKKINESKMAFKCMENINAFLEVCKVLGVPPQETFQTVDLWERQNLNSVVICLQSLGRKVLHSEFINLLKKN